MRAPKRRLSFVLGVAICLQLVLPALAASIGVGAQLAAAADVTITTASLSNGVQGTAYPGITLDASGGTPFPSGPLYTFTVIAGELPAGLVITFGSFLFGTPTVAGTFSFTLRAMDSLGATGDRALSVTIAPSPTPPLR